MPLGLRVEWAGTARFPWDQVKAFIEFAPATSAIVKVEHTPEVAEWTTLHEMLRNVEYSLALLFWAKTADGQKNINRPTRRPRPGYAPKPEMSLDPQDPASDTHVIGGHGVSVDDMAKMLGWEPPPPNLRR